MIDLPQHVAVILDGNRRWAREHGVGSGAGYRAGGANVVPFLSWCEQAGIDRVTLWPLSTENLHRDQQELAELLQVIVEVTGGIMDEGRWGVRVIGNLNLLPVRYRHVLGEITQRPHGPIERMVTIGVAYGGRDEIVRAVRGLLLSRRAAGALQDLDWTVEADDIAHHLDTTGQPDPDLIIRTGGEQRLSGFMSWQSAYAELYFSRVPWPDFTAADLQDALDFYRTRPRRFGM